jgi:hypothetical protein
MAVEAIAIPITSFRIIYFPFLAKLSHRVAGFLTFPPKGGKQAFSANCCMNASVQALGIEKFVNIALLVTAERRG